jgi:hypothetical protein
MAHDVKSLLAMSQAELDTLFSSVPAGPIPDASRVTSYRGQATGLMSSALTSARCKCAIPAM